MGESIQEGGWMRVKTARTSQEDGGPRECRQRAKLTVRIGTSYVHTGWFTIFDLDTYDIILGKDWFTHLNLRHEIDHVNNRMWI